MTRERPAANVVCFCRHRLDDHRAERGCLRCTPGSCAGGRYRKRGGLVIRNWWRLAAPAPDWRARWDRPPDIRPLFPETWPE